ncbi:MAG: beta-ketoacyl synthase chain length factor [Neisseria sp.]|nr:beta-ketoacyl synthase chain length factor [Neisseria sp.]
MIQAEPACRFSFRIAAMRAVCPHFAAPEDWQTWARDGAFDAAAVYKPALDFLPAMQRRRLGVSARLVFDAAWPLAEAHPPCPMVFASHDGELNRSVELWLGLLREGSVSPTSFGLSVHNALAGQWSMLRGDMSENTALSVRCDGLETALAEAYALLQEGAERVLVVVADEPLKSEYAVAAERAPFAYALAMMVEAGDDYTLSLMPSEKVLPNQAGYDGALDWLRFTYSDGLEHRQHYDTRAWLWQKK